MRLHYSYTNYPLSPELTKKSRSIAELTHPLYGAVAGVCLWGATIALDLPMSEGLFNFIMVAFPIAGAILIVKYRKKRFAQLDAEYKKIVQASQR